MSDKSFAHLHVHTQYSMLDGAAGIDALARAAAEQGMPAIASTDHGSMAGTYDFWKTAAKHGVKYIPGIEAYVAPGVPRTHREAVRWGNGGDDDVSGGGAYLHQTLLGVTTEGMINLFKMTSQSYIDGMYKKPRCLLPGQEIMTRSGMKRIEEIRVGDEVLTHLGRFMPVIRTMRNHHDGPVYGIRLNQRYRRVTWMTGEHPVLVRHRNGSLNWIQARDIVPGRPGKSERATNHNSWVCMPRYGYTVESATIRVDEHVRGWTYSDERGRWVKESVTRRRTNAPTRYYADFPSVIALDHAFGFFLGLYAAEGHIDRGRTVTFSFHVDETELVEAVSTQIRILTGKTPSIRTRPDRPDYRGVDVSVSSSVLAEFLESLMGSGASNKRLPDCVWDAPETFARGLWSGVMAGYGSYRRGRVIPLGQTSEALHWQMRTLSASLSADFVNTYVAESDNPAHAPMFYGYHTPLDREGGPRKTLSDDQYVYKPITAVEETHYSGWVYNIEVAEDHSYVSDFAIHNCDDDLLAAHAAGVVATTGCPSGAVQTWLRLGDYGKAKDAAGRYAEIFGKDNFFVEVMDHGLAIERRVIADLKRISKDLAIPLLATNDLHYVSAGDTKMHEALLCIGSGSTLDDPKRFKFDGDTYYLRSAAEMRALFDDEMPGACDNTLLIAERAAATFEDHGNLMPRFPVPDGHTEGTWLIHEVKAGLARRYPGGIPDDRLAQAKYECEVINQMGFPGYFLVVADFIGWAKANGIRVGPGRGSAAGSIVAYALGITDLDPIRHGLLFERFLNPERISMPDIDIDFDDQRRGEVIEYVTAKYGSDKVANVTTIQVIKARQAIKDASRVLGYPYGLGEKINKTYPAPVVGRDLPLSGAFDPGHDRYSEAGDFRNLVESDPDVKKVVGLAREIEGSKRTHGMHAAGVIMSRDPLSDHVPLMRTRVDGPLMTAFEYPSCEALGLLKMDFLGLSNLGTIDEALRLIERNRGETLDLDAIAEALDDVPTYRLLASGNTLGVFQLDSPPIRSLLRLMRPDRFEDVSATIALYRPGPMGANAHIDYADRKNGRKPITPIHPELAEPLAEILSDTYGLIVYQEQVMAIAQKVAGYSLGAADNLRRAMGKKKKEILDKEFPPFRDAMLERGYTAEAIQTLWDILVPFSDYAFNRAHSAAYGVVSYLTAYLKANYPAEYMAALLTTNADDKDKTALYLGECRRMGINVLPPDINASIENYAAVGPDIRFGLVGVKNVGHGVVQSILSARATHGPFTSFADFLISCDAGVLRKKAIESLIKAGALDSLGHTRAALESVHIAAVENAAKVKKAAEANAGQESLWGEDDTTLILTVDVPDRPEWDKKTLLSYEREMLGLYVSDHPLNGVAHLLAGQRDVVSLASLREPSMASGSVIKVSGLITSVTRKTTKKGDAYAVVVVEDLDSSITINCFPRTYDECYDVIAHDKIVLVEGRLEVRDDASVSITANTLREVDLVALADPESVPLVLATLEERITAPVVAALKDALRAHPGRTPVHLRLARPDGSRVLLALGPEYAVRRGPEVISAIKAVLGVDSIA